MATRRQVREAFYTELETAASGIIPAGNISQQNPDSSEDLPAIVHNDNYRKVPMNRGAAPVKVDTNADGEQTYYYASMMQARFSVNILAEDEQTKENAYEAVRTHFEAYTHPHQDESTIQSDVHDVDVSDSTSVDEDSRDPVARGDRLEITLGFKRLYAEDVTPATSVQHNIDGGNDGTTDATYTTN